MSSAWPTGKYGAILADPPWTFQAWYAGGWRLREDGTKYYSAASPKAAQYPTMSAEDIAAMPVADIAEKDCVLFLWGCWPMLPQALQVIDGWGFKYKSCGFPDMLLGYWTRANTEFCLIGTRGKPKRIAADVRQAIIAPRREHSRKPDGIHERIERLVAGPYLELFARQERKGWDVWGNQTDKFKAIS